MEAFIKVDESLIKDLLETQNQILFFLKKKDNQAKDKSEFISLREASSLYSMSYDFFYDRVKNGSLVSSKIGNRIRVKKADIEALIQSS